MLIPPRDCRMKRADEMLSAPRRLSPKTPASWSKASWLIKSLSTRVRRFKTAVLSRDSKQFSGRAALAVRT